MTGHSDGLRIFDCNAIIAWVKLLSVITNKEADVATNLVVRNVEEDVALALKQMAAAHGRSAEAGG